MKTTRKILLVEDTKKHRDEGQKVLLSAGYEVVTAENYSEAIYNPIGIRGNQYDAVVTDIFMPTSEECPNLVPAGIGIVLAARAKGIPVVMCSDRHHHAEGMEWIHTLQCGSEDPELHETLIDGIVDAEGDWLKNQDEAIKNGLGSKQWQQVPEWLNEQFQAD